MAYVAAYEKGLQIIDVSDPSPRKIVGSVKTPKYARDIQIIDNLAFVVDNASGLQVIDVNDPENPKIVGSVDTPHFANEIAVVDNIAYVADDNSGLQIIDVGNPARPKIIASLDTPCRAFGLCVEDQVAYIADCYTLQLIDVSNPYKPEVLGAIDTQDIACGVDVVGDIAYVAVSDHPFYPNADESMIQLVDVSDSRNPKILGSVSTPGNAYDITSVGSIIYLPADDKGLQIIDVSNKYHPKIISSVDTPDDAYNVTLVDKTAYVATTESGIHVVDVTNPESPVVIGSVNTPGSVKAVAVSAQTAYVADDYAGLSIVPIPRILQKVSYVNKNELHAIIPGAHVAGHYNIRAFSKSESYTLWGAVSFLKPKEHSFQRYKKAIIASGGSIDDRLSACTKKCSNWAYLALMSQGYSKQNIRYLSPHASIDVDGDGQNDVNNICTSSILSAAIQDWAGKDASELFIYLIDHGGQGTFEANQGDIIQAADLDTWLDNAQSTIPGKVILVYDACYSGSFLPLMTPPPDREQVVITSSAADEETWFMEKGVMSFGYQFWSSVFGNANLFDSYKVAQGMIENSQTPILDANGDGKETSKDKELIGDFLIGRGRIAASSPPKIGKVSDDQTLSGEQSASLWAGNIASLNPLQRVWAVIIPPDYESTYTGEAVTDLASLDLTDPDGDGIYTGTFSHFSKQGTYKITFHAQDAEGLYALPKTSQVIQQSGKPISQEPIPSIYANGQDSLLTVSNNSEVSISISVSPGKEKGTVTEWWLAADTPLGWLFYVYPKGWQSEVKPCIQAPLFSLPKVEIPNPPVFMGSNTFYFVVDDNANGVPEVTWRDMVRVNVQ